MVEKARESFGEVGKSQIKLIFLSLAFVLILALSVGFAFAAIQANGGECYLDGDTTLVADHNTCNNLSMEDHTLTLDGYDLTVSNNITINGTGVTGVLDATAGGFVACNNLTIEDNGLYYASYNTTVTDTFENYADSDPSATKGFKHNNGSVYFDLGGYVGTYELPLFNGTVFNNLSFDGPTVAISALSSNWVTNDNITVLDTLNMSDFAAFTLYGWGIYLGNASQSGQIVGNNEILISAAGGAALPPFIYGDSESYYGVISNEDTFLRAIYASGKNLHLKWVDVRAEVFTDKYDVKLDGDCIFEDIEIGSDSLGYILSDGFVANGYVANVTGNIVISGNNSYLGGTADQYFKTLDVQGQAVGPEGTYNCTTATTHITGEDANGYALTNLSQITTNNGTINITTQADTLLNFDVSLNDSNFSLAMGSAYTAVMTNYTNWIQNDLYIMSGSLDLNVSDNLDLNVTGDTVIESGNISANQSAVIFNRSLTILSSGTYYAPENASGSKTTIGTNLTNSGTLTHNNGFFEFNSTDEHGFIQNSTDLYNVSVASNLTLNASVNFSYINITNVGNLTYNATNTDTGVYYTKTTGGEVHIGDGITLTSDACYLDGTQITADTAGAAYWIDDIGTGGDWLVSGRADGTACSVAAECSGGYCNSNVCASSAPVAAAEETTTTTTTGGTAAPATTASKTATFSNVAVGQTLTIKPASSLIAVTEVSAVSAEDKASAKISVKNHASIPATVSAPPSGGGGAKKVYQYLDITADVSIKSAEVKFKVSNDWLAEQKAGTKDVVLMHYDGDNWNDLPTEHISGEEYKATTQSFSTFAISAKVAEESGAVSGTLTSTWKALSALVSKELRTTRLIFLALFILLVLYFNRGRITGKPVEKMDAKTRNILLAVFAIIAIILAVFSTGLVKLPPVVSDKLSYASDSIGAQFARIDLSGVSAKFSSAGASLKAGFQNAGASLKAGASGAGEGLSNFGSKVSQAFGSLPARFAGISQNPTSEQSISIYIMIGFIAVVIAAAYLHLKKK